MRFAFFSRSGLALGSDNKICWGCCCFRKSQRERVVPTNGSLAQFVGLERRDLHREHPGSCLCSTLEAEAHGLHSCCCKQTAAFCRCERWVHVFRNYRMFEGTIIQIIAHTSCLHIHKCSPMLLECLPSPELQVSPPRLVEKIKNFIWRPTDADPFQRFMCNPGFPLRFRQAW